MATLLIEKPEMLTWEAYLPDVGVYMYLCENEMSSFQRGKQCSRGKGWSQSFLGVQTWQIINISEPGSPTCNIWITPFMKWVAVRIKWDEEWRALITVLDSCKHEIKLPFNFCKVKSAFRVRVCQWVGCKLLGHNDGGHTGQVTLFSNPNSFKDYVSVWSYDGFMNYQRESDLWSQSFSLAIIFSKLFDFQSVYVYGYLWRMIMIFQLW